MFHIKDIFLRCFYYLQSGLQVSHQIDIFQIVCIVYRVVRQTGWGAGHGIRRSAREGAKAAGLPHRAGSLPDPGGDIPRLHQEDENIKKSAFYIPNAKLLAR